MEIVRAYMTPENKHKLHLMALQGGYIGQTVKVSTKGLSQYISDFLNRSCQFTCDRAYLDQTKAKATPYNLVKLELPFDMATHMPKHFGLETWGQILQNIVVKNIIPVDNAYPSVIEDFSNPRAKEMKQDYINIHLEKEAEVTIHRNVGRRYQMHTDIKQKQVHQLDVLEPTAYKDNRPLPDLTAPRGKYNDDLQGPVAAWAYCWYIPHMPRTTRYIYVTDEDVEKLRKVAEHWHILPVKRRTDEAKLTIVLEALIHNLLVPVDTPDTQLNTLDC